jgi:hypothetical protein
MPPIPPMSMPPMSIPPMSIPGNPPKPPNPKPYVSFLITGPIAAWSLTISFCKWFWNFTNLSKTLLYAPWRSSSSISGCSSNT